MHLNGRPVASYDPEGLIFAAGIDSRQLKLYDLRTFDKVGRNFLVERQMVTMVIMIMTKALQ